VKFGEEIIRGIKYQIEITSTGEFYVEVDGDRISGPTLEIVKRKLSDHVKAMAGSISIPFVYWRPAEWDDKWDDKKPCLVKAECVGIHAGNDNLLIKQEGGKVQQMSHYHRVRAFDPKHAAKLTELGTAKHNAIKAFDDFNKNELDLKAMVQEKLKKGETK